MTDQTSTPDQPPAVTEPFLVALQRVLRPEVLAAAGEQMAELVENVTALRKKGRMVLTIELTPHERIIEAVEITAKAKATHPTPPPIARIMYADGGRLVADDPRQQKFDLEPGPRLVRDDRGEAAR